MATTPELSGITEQYKLPDTKKAGNPSLGKAEFMALLIAQLQNQDPTSPMDNGQMMAQMATLGQLDAINAMSSSMLQSQTYAMIGTGVMGNIVNPDGTQSDPIIGTVDSAGIESGKPYVMVGNVKLFAENIQQVFDQSIIKGGGEAMVAATSMVGKYARANTAGTGTPNYIEGLVTRWWSDEGTIFITLDGRDVPLNQIVAVADSKEAIGKEPGQGSDEDDIINA